MRQYHRRSSSVARQNQGIKQSRNRITMREFRRMNDGAVNLRRICSFKEIGLRRRRNETLLPSNLTLAGSEVDRVGANRESSLGTVSPEECKKGYYCFIVAVWVSCWTGIELRYAACVDERV